MALDLLCSAYSKAPGQKADKAASDAVDKMFAALEDPKKFDAKTFSGAAKIFGDTLASNARWPSGAGTRAPAPVVPISRAGDRERQAPPAGSARRAEPAAAELARLDQPDEERVELVVLAVARFAQALDRLCAHRPEHLQPP